LRGPYESSSGVMKPKETFIDAEYANVAVNENEKTYKAMKIIVYIRAHLKPNNVVVVMWGIRLELTVIFFLYPKRSSFHFTTIILFLEIVQKVI